MTTQTKAAASDADANQAKADALLLLCSALIKCRSVGVATYRDGDQLTDAMAKLGALGYQVIMVPADFKAFDLSDDARVVMGGVA